VRRGEARLAPLVSDPPDEPQEVDPCPLRATGRGQEDVESEASSLLLERTEFAASSLALALVRLEFRRRARRRSLRREHRRLRLGAAGHRVEELSALELQGAPRGLEALEELGESGDVVARRNLTRRTRAEVLGEQGVRPREGEAAGTQPIGDGARLVARELRSAESCLLVVRCLVLRPRFVRARRAIGAGCSVAPHTSQGWPSTRWSRSSRAWALRTAA
jgi:hypothetical protein